MNTDQIKLFRKKLREIERAVGLGDKNEAVCCGVTLAQCHALLEIGSSGELSIKKLSSLLGLDKSTLSRTVDSLVDQGMAERAPGAEDRRFISIRLTPKGKTVFNRINTTWNRICADMFKNIPVKKHAQIIEAAGLIAETLTQCTCEFQNTKSCVK
jgi:DNA-binding MarR family transcriptional regulator